MRKPYYILLLLMTAFQLVVFPAISLADGESAENGPVIVNTADELRAAIKAGEDVCLGKSISNAGSLTVKSTLELDGHTLSGDILTVSGTVQNGALNFSRIHNAGGTLENCSYGKSNFICHLLSISVPISGKVICITGYTDGQLISDDPVEENAGSYWTVVDEPTLVIIRNASLGNIWFDLTGNSPVELSWDITYLNAAGDELSGLTPSTYKTSETSEKELKLAETYTDEKGTTYKIDSYIDPPDGIIPAQTSGAISVTVGKVSKAESHGQGGGGFSPSGFSGGGFSGGGRSGGTSGLSNASALSEAESDDSAIKASSGSVISASVATAASFLGTGGGRRLASANSSIKSSLSQELPEMDLSEVSARFDASKKSDKQLSWGIVAAGGLILAGLVLLVLLIRKNSQERTAEIYEKLHIQQ